MRWTFEHEARWMLWVLLVPAILAIAAALLIPRVIRAL
jgi:hypothetical protein